MTNIVVSALYKFVTLDDYKSLKSPFLAAMLEYKVKGTLLLAKEGINGTLAGERCNLDALLAVLRSDRRLSDLKSKESYAEHMPFHRSKVKLKKEIVTLGVSNIDPKQLAGTHVKPKDWNALVGSEDVMLIDARNNYEVEIGCFKGAINPTTNTFRDFPSYAKQQLDPAKHKKIAMYCTGGIRCEKSTAFLKQQGFEEVYQLQGGILKYLEEVAPKHSLWQGECFVFDGRVAINHALEKGRYDQCHACRYPITEADKSSEYYKPGVSCPHCHDSVSKQQRNRFQEREKQMAIAKARGESHIGSSMQHICAQRRALKYQHKDQQRHNN